MSSGEQGHMLTRYRAVRLGGNCLDRKVHFQQQPKPHQETKHIEKPNIRVKSNGGSKTDIHSLYF